MHDGSHVLASHDEQRAPGAPVLTDDQVVALRTMRAETKLGWRQLGERFGIHAKSVYRICRGMTRPKAGGPLEPQALIRLREPDVATLPRCPVCGCKLTERHCGKCQMAWQSAILKVIRDSGLLARRKR